MLFQKLAILTRTSPLVTLAIAREGDKLRITITPKHPGKLENDDAEPHEAALVYPLTITGTPEELDADLVAEIERYLATREGLVSQIGDYEQEMQAAKLNLKATAEVSKKKRGAMALPAPATPAEAPATDPAPENPKAQALAGV